MMRQSAQVSTFTPIPPKHLHLEPEACPACGQDIPADKLEEITGKIAAHEREKARALSERLERDHAFATAQVQAKAKADLEEERRQSAQREEAARETAKLEAESAAALALTEYKRDQEQTKQALKERIEVAETAQQQSEVDRANLQTRLNDHKQYRSEHVSKLKLEVNPARVVAIATIVRLHLIQLDTLRSSEIEREKKTEALYDFITSEQCCLLLDRIDTKAAGLLKLQEAEMKWHNNHWNKEGEALRDIQKAKADLAFSITSVIGATADSDEPADEATEEIPW